MSLLDFLTIIYVFMNMISTFKDFEEDKITYETAASIIVFDGFIMIIFVLL